MCTGKHEGYFMISFSDTTREEYEHEFKLEKGIIISLTLEERILFEDWLILKLGNRGIQVGNNNIQNNTF